MWKMEKEFVVKLGGVTYINTPNLIVCKGQSLFRIRRSENEGILGIDFDMYDSKGAKVATVANAIVVQGDKTKYTITTGHDEYTVKENSTGRLIASIKRRGVQGAELEVSVDLYTPSGFHLMATPTKTNIGNLTLGVGVIKDCGAGIVID